MLPPARLPQFGGDKFFDLNTALDGTIAVPYARRNGLWNHVPMADKASGAFAIGVANGGSLTIATVSAGNKPILVQVDCAASAAGRYQVRYAGVMFKEIKLPANSTMAFAFPPYGLFFTTAAATFDIVNLTGAAVDLSGSAVWAEVTV